MHTTPTSARACTSLKAWDRPGRTPNLVCLLSSRPVAVAAMIAIMDRVPILRRRYLPACPDIHPLML